MRLFHRCIRFMKNRLEIAIALAIIPVAVGIGVGSALAQVPFTDAAQPLASLKTVPVPEPPNLNEFVQDKAAAVQLGKALFWDMQVGSDGATACATCHHQAGADSRSKNQLNPGSPGGDLTFQIGGPNHALTQGDFPFTKHQDPSSVNSPLLSSRNDVAGSQGVTLAQFIDIVPGSAVDNCASAPDALSHVKGTNVRRTTGRKAPSVINAVFNFRNFWDGRANNNFNGVNPFGERDPNARIWKLVNGQVQQVKVVIPLASLASQAVGPPLNDVEMSCAGRTFPDLGKKLLSSGLVPLGKQQVHQNDSVLGPIARSRSPVGFGYGYGYGYGYGSQPANGVLGATTKGLTVSYADLIKKAFKPEYWSATSNVSVSGGGQFTQMQANFSLFFGLAIQLYEATLVSDDTPFDRFLMGDSNGLTPQQKLGFGIFAGPGQCVACHAGAELTGASVRNVSVERLERMIIANGSCGVYDNGFYNIGVRPTAEDLGVGGLDPFGNPLSETRMALSGKFVDPLFFPQLGQMPGCDTHANVDGAFKTPGLRNVELGGPYFHNGSQATLRQVVDFYNRGADFAKENIANLDFDIAPIGLSEEQKSALVSFLVALTDERVRWEKAPFDHPELCIPNGHTGDAANVVVEGGRAKDNMRCLPAVGTAGAIDPLKPFLGLSPFLSEDMPPSVSVLTPTSGQAVEGVITLRATAKDDISVAKVEYAIQKTSLAEVFRPLVQSGAPGEYVTSINTVNMPDGLNTITIRTTDASGRIALSEVSVIAHNRGPAVQFVSPVTPTSGKKQTIRLTATATSSSVATVQWQVVVPAPGTSPTSAPQPDPDAWQNMVFNPQGDAWETTWIPRLVVRTTKGWIYIRATDSSDKASFQSQSFAITPSGKEELFTGASGERLQGRVTVEPIGNVDVYRVGVEFLGDALRPNTYYSLVAKGPDEVVIVGFTTGPDGRGHATSEMDIAASTGSSLTFNVYGPGFSR